jgi:aldehyde dehydrogenase (NAD+)
MENQNLEAPVELMQSVFNDLKANFQEGETLSVAFRKDSLQKLRRIIKSSEKDILAASKKDLGINSHTTYLTSISTLLAEIDHVLRYLNRWTQPQTCETAMVLFPSTTFNLSEPLGVVLIIGAWNYPLPTSLIPFISAIAAGNCVIVKPSENAPESSRIIAKIISQMDQRFYRTIEGGVETSRFLNKQKFDLIIFTGGSSTGKFIMKDAAENLVPVVLELGGKNPTIVDVSANIDLTVKRIVSFKFMNCGQTCTSGDFIFVHSAIKDLFVSSLIQKLKEFFGTDAKACPDYSKIINQFHTKRIMNYLEGQQKNIIYQSGSCDLNTCFIPPTVLLNPSFDSLVMKDEIFGPILPIVEFTEFKEVMKYMQKSEKSLCVYYFGDLNSLNYNTLKVKTSSGSLVANDLGIHYASFTTGFGGVGSSGIGRIRGYEGFKCCSNQKAVIERSRSGFLDLSIRYPPYTPAVIRQMKFFLNYAGDRTFEEIFRIFKNIIIGVVVAVVLYVLFSRGILVVNLK